MRLLVMDSTHLPIEVCTTQVRQQAQIGALLIDLRERHESAALAFDAPEILLFPFGELEHRWAELPRDRDLILVCQTGEKSVMAAEFLDQKGFIRASPMRGGVLLWMQKGYPVTGKRFDSADAPVPADDFSEKDQ